MWKFANPIKHPIGETRWPSAEEAARLTVHPDCHRQPRSSQPHVGSRDGALARYRGRIVTQQNLDWYSRFAEGRPGVLVVEATGVRDIPSGPLLRIGDDRFIPGLRKLVDVVREASEGQTLLFIQIIDFAVKRRPEAKYLQRFLEVDEHHRRALAEFIGNDAWLEASDSDLREFLLNADDAILDAVLGPRELEALQFGYRERVTDMHLKHIRELPSELPGIFASAETVLAKLGSMELSFTMHTRTRWRGF